MLEVMDKKATSGAQFVDGLLSEAVERAEGMLACPIERTLAGTMDDDGFSNLERLEMSPLAEDQLLALALRLASEPGRHGCLRDALAGQFHAAPTSFAIEAQRRAVLSGAEGGRLPTGAARDAVDALAGKLKGHAAPDLSEALAHYAALYADLWCNPRIGAPLAVRRVMLAMVTLLYERSAAWPAPTRRPVRRFARGRL